MWKKTEETPQRPPEPRSAAAPASIRQDVATIGPSIAIQGDLTGDEDLMIQGRIEGEISLPKNSVTVGKSGRVRADINGRSIRVEGEVRGNLYGEAEVVIRASGRVQGNIVSPRVTLENGSKFKGSIDMEPKKPAPQPKPAEPRSTPPPAERPRQGAPAKASSKAPPPEGGKAEEPQIELKPSPSGG